MLTDSRSIERDTALGDGARSPLEGATKEQESAIAHQTGPAVCVAGAGSGKTRVLTGRIANLIQSGSCHPSEVLALTFGRRASMHLIERLSEWIPPEEAEAVRTGTFHSVALKILREFGHAVGVDAETRICDQGRSERLVREAVLEDALTDQLDTGEVLRGIEIAKRTLGRHLARRCAGRKEDIEAYRRPSEELFREVMLGHELQVKPPAALLRCLVRYQAALRDDGALDFQDILAVAAILLANNADLRGLVHQRWRHILVDEYQDTDPLQEELLILMAGDARNVFVVGDDDQAIFGFRAAEVGLIRTFEDRWPGASRYTLTRNFRSTPEIIDVANRIAALQGERPTPKNLRSMGAPGCTPILWSSPSAEEEADRTVRFLHWCRATGRIKDYSEALILSRAGWTFSALERSLRDARVPYQMSGRRSLLEQPAVRRVVELLRLSERPGDAELFGEVLRRSVRGVGARSAERLEAAARQAGMSVTDLAASDLPIPGVGAKIRGRIGQLGRGIIRIRAEDRVTGATGALHEAVRFSDALGSSIEDMGLLEASGRERDARRVERKIESVRELVRWAEELGPGLSRDGAPSTRSFLDFLDVEADAGTRPAPWDEGEEAPEEPALSLLTIHAAKGLEAKVVIVLGLEDGSIPNMPIGATEPEDRDEEIRLFYVAATRAEEVLVLSQARSRERPTVGLIAPPRSRYLTPGILERTEVRIFT